MDQKFIFDSNLHADVYLNQMSDSNFSSTSSDFKIGTITSFANYLLNMNKDNFGQSVIDSKIQSFNNLGTGYEISPTTLKYYTGTLSLEINHNKNIYPVKYEPVKN